MILRKVHVLSYICLSAILAILSVLQAGLNEKILPKLGVSVTVMLNSLILLTVSIVVWSCLKVFNIEVPQFMASEGQVGGWKWWYLIPGVLGYCLVAGLPVSFSFLGAGKTMLILVVGQILGGFVWDWSTGSRNLSLYDALAAGLAILSGLVVFMGSAN